MKEANGTFKSTFVRDQLTKLATEAEEIAFINDMAMTFGVDSPWTAYRVFYQRAKAGMPELPHQLSYGGDAEYDREAQRIGVDHGLAVKAMQGDELSQWHLLLALIQAYGQHLEHPLRHVWSTVGGPSQTTTGSLYALSLLPLDEPGETAYATPHKLVRQAELAYQQAVDTHGTEGVPVLHDGVYRPERDGVVKPTPVFDAKMMKDEPKMGVHNHHSIELALAADPRFQAYERGMIYDGNWLRDWSPMCDAFMLPPGQKGQGLSRESITTAVMLMGQLVASTYLKTPWTGTVRGRTSNSPRSACPSAWNGWGVIDLKSTSTILRACPITELASVQRAGCLTCRSTGMCWRTFLPIRILWNWRCGKPTT